MSYDGEDKVRIRRLRTQEAISLAMQGKWESAIETNKDIIEMFPTDADAYNRLGRAYIELGNYGQAKDAYATALGLDPGNVIAQKNIQRLSHLKDKEKPVSREEHRRVPIDLFIEETGKAGMIPLFDIAPKEMIAKVVTGDQVNLKVQDNDLIVEDISGIYLGRVESTTALRLIKLIEGGNQYEAALAGIKEDEAKVIIREKYQHPSQAGKMSFPARELEGFRPYAKESLLRYDLGEAESTEEEELHSEQEELIAEGFELLGEIYAEIETPAQENDEEI